jgi:hypothetical protein
MTDKYNINYLNDEDCCSQKEPIYSTNILFKNANALIFSSSFFTDSTLARSFINIFITKISHGRAKDCNLNYKVDKLSFKVSNESKGKVLSFISKLNEEGEIIAFAITYEDNYFELILVNLRYKMLKSKFKLIIEFTSDQVFNNFRESDKIITDLFISGNFLISVFNFQFLIILDIQTFEIISNSHNNEFKNILILDSFFKETYNKCLYVFPLIEQVGSSKEANNLNENIEEDLKTNAEIHNFKKVEFFLITKKKNLYLETLLKPCYKVNTLTKLVKLINDKDTTFCNNKSFNYSENFKIGKFDLT